MVRADADALAAVDAAFGIICALPFRTRIACVGHRFMQLVQPMHFSSSSRTEWKYVFIWKTLPAPADTGAQSAIVIIYCYTL